MRDVRTKEEIESQIINYIKEISLEQYGGYAFIDSIKNGISKVMFGKYITSLPQYEFGNGRGKGIHATRTYTVQLITNEELDKVEKIYNAMLSKGYFRISKSNTMAKLVK